MAEVVVGRTAASGEVPKLSNAADHPRVHFQPRVDDGDAHAGACPLVVEPQGLPEVRDRRHRASRGSLREQVSWENAALLQERSVDRHRQNGGSRCQEADLA
jgi:hypothetical protein